MASEVERFESHIYPDPNTGCWLWGGCSNTQGYGKVTVRSGRGKKVFYPGAHRRSYELYISKIPSGQIVCHKCDTPACVNPDRLFLGTHKDNIQDAIEKGRFAWTTRTHCIKGHAWSKDNSYYHKRKDTGRVMLRCLTCKRDAGRAFYRRSKNGAK